MGLVSLPPATAFDIPGGGSPDHILGSQSDDNIWGYGGYDTLEGRSGADNIWGGEGNDKLYGDDGDDDLIGETGADSLFGGDGDDMLEPGTGPDVVYGGDDNDIITNLYVDTGLYFTRYGVLLTSAPDYIDCGDGYDRVYVTKLDPNDKFVNCERLI